MTELLPQPVVTIAKNERGAWCVYLDGEFVSDHRDRAAAAIAANRHISGASAPERPRIS